MTKTTKDELLTDAVSEETVDAVVEPKMAKPIKAKTKKEKVVLEDLPEEVIAEVKEAVEATGPTFADRNLRPTILESLTKKGYTTPTPIQLLTFKHFTE